MVIRSIYYLKCSKTGTGDLLISVQAFDPIRIPIPTQEQEQTIIELLEKLLLCSDAETCKALDERLSNYVAKLYGFNEEEKPYYLLGNTKMKQNRGICSDFVS